MCNSVFSAANTKSSFHLWSSSIQIDHVGHSKKNSKRAIQEALNQLKKLSSQDSYKALISARQFHAHAIQRRETSIVVQNALLNMYLKCGSVIDARQLFDNMSEIDLFTWTTMVAGYTQNGDGKEAIKLFQEMRQNGFKPDMVTYVSILSATAHAKLLGWGKYIHADSKIAIKADISGLEAVDMPFQNTLLSMYTKSGDMNYACQVFDRIVARNIVTWTIMIMGYTHHGHGNEPIILFQIMQSNGFNPDSVMYVSVVSACSAARSLGWGKCIHAGAIRSGFGSDIFIGSAILTLYMKCGSTGDALQVFHNMPIRNMVTWNAMLSGFAEHGNSVEVLKMFLEMQKNAFQPDQVTYTSVLHACTSAEYLAWGKYIHACYINFGLGFDLVVENALIDMYANCGSIKDACQLFEEMPRRDLVSWNTLLTVYAQRGDGRNAFRVLLLIQHYGLKPDKITYTVALNLSPNTKTLEWGKFMHSFVIRTRLDVEVSMASILIGLYSKSGSIRDAWFLFDTMPITDLFSWTSIISGLAEQGNYKEAFSLFWKMQECGVVPDEVAHLSMLDVAASSQSLEWGKKMHACIINSGWDLDTSVQNNIIAMYVQCGTIKEARKVFDRMSIQDIISWTTMVSAYSQHSDINETMKLISQMQEQGLQLDRVACISILSICATTGALQWGKQIHRCLVEIGIEQDILLDNALLSMYMNCGSINDARKLFDRMLVRDIVSWNTMIMGYGQHGSAYEAIKLFDDMQRLSIVPDRVTLISLLTSCSNGLLGNNGVHYLCSFGQVYNIEIASEAYAAMAGLLCRAGDMEETKQFIDAMPFPPDVVVWMACLGTCRNDSDITIAELATIEIIRLDPSNIAALILLSNIYALAGRWDDKRNVRKRLEETVRLF